MSAGTGAEGPGPAATADTEASTVRLALETDDEAGVVTAIESDGFVAAGAERPYVSALYLRLSVPALNRPDVGT